MVIVLSTSGLDWMLDLLLEEGGGGGGGGGGEGREREREGGEKHTCR